MQLLTGLLETWSHRAAELEPYAPAAAEAFRCAATELRAQLRDAEDSVTLREAHLIGGYSVDHLQRLVAAGTLENVGKKGRPRIRRCDVPVKPGHAVLRSDGESPQLTPSAVVASALGRRSR